MALPTGSGTETLHAHHFEDVDNITTLIKGYQHHVYTVLSIIVCCRALDATTDEFWIDVKGYNSHGGASGGYMRLAQQNIQVNDTWVWNDKFSFNGFEPTGTPNSQTNSYTTGYQATIAAQAGSTAQELIFDMTSSDDGGQDYDIHVTFIDQDFS